MNKSILNKKTIRNAIVAVLVIVGVLLSLHLLVNNIDLFGLIRSMHGG